MLDSASVLNISTECRLTVAEGAGNSYCLDHEDSPFGVAHAEHARYLD